MTGPARKLPDSSVLNCCRFSNQRRGSSRLSPMLCSWAGPRRHCGPTIALPVTTVMYWLIWLSDSARS